MARINLNHRLAGVDNVDVFVGHGFRIGSVLEASTKAGPVAAGTQCYFSVGLSATALSATSASFTAPAATIVTTSDMLGKVVAELIRKRVLEGTIAE